MIVPDDQHAGANAEQTIAACRSLLDTLQQAIQQRKWARVSPIAAAYSEQISALAAGADEGLREDLIQLEMRHRRCMRMLSRQMKTVADDISSLEQGQKNLQRSQQAVSSMFQ